MSHFKSDEFRRSRRVQMSNTNRKRCTLAVWSLILGLLVFIPFAAPVALLLGLFALIRIHRNALLVGRGLAVAGLLLGLVGTAAQGLVGIQISRLHEGVADGPQNALAAGFRGDIQTFKGAFGARGTTLSDEHALAFLAALEQRYGTFREVEFVDQPGQSPIHRVGVPAVYRFVFDSGRLGGEAMLNMPEGLPLGDGVLAYVRVRDAQRGDLVFPGPKPGPTQVVGTDS